MKILKTKRILSKKRRNPETKKNLKKKPRKKSPKRKKKNPRMTSKKRKNKAPHSRMALQSPLLLCGRGIFLMLKVEF